MEKIYAFVDGSNNPKTMEYGYGAILHVNNERYILYDCFDDKNMAKMRNVAGEICGSMAAVSKAIELGCKEITIYYDYKGIECWATGEWKTNKEETRKYAEFMNNAKNSIDIHFKKVKGHSGVEENEYADILAKFATKIELTKKQKETLDKILK